MRALSVFLLCCGVAAAQGSAMKDKVKKQMEEISRLMRDSERLLLELTKVDQVVAAQTEVVDELRKLQEQTPPKDAAARAQREQGKKKLEGRQGELTRKFEEMFKGQKARGERAVYELQELLRNLPRQQNGGGGDSDEKRRRRQQRDRQKQLREQQREQKQQQNQLGPRDKRERRELRSERRPRDKTEGAARQRRVEAWIARLPPEDQARINRNDLSTIPTRYRKLVREYTAARAKREAEEEKK